MGIENTEDRLAGPRNNTQNKLNTKEILSNGEISH